MDNVEDNSGKRDHGHGRVWIALTLLCVGGMLLAQQFGAEFPYWLVSWQMLLIVIGVFQGFSHGFRGGGWLVMILIGGIFLVEDVFPGARLHKYLWPFAIIVVGFVILIRPKKNSSSGDRKQWKSQFKQKGYLSNYVQKPPSGSGEDFIDATTVFGGIHRTVVSKNFRGGDITVFMGGSEINLTQADISGVAVLDITQIMGGTKLIVPPHWEVRSELTSVFGNIEDKRQQTVPQNPDKVLVIDGTSIFGGIEIKNY